MTDETEKLAKLMISNVSKAKNARIEKEQKTEDGKILMDIEEKINNL